MGIKITGDFEEFNGELRRLVDFNFTGLHKEIGEYLLETTKDRFKDEESPDGEKWEESHRAKKKGGQTLTDKATLKNSITYKATSRKTDVGSNVIYAAVHQKGKKIKFKSRNLTVKMPKRAFLGINSGDQAEVKEIIRDRILEHTRGTTSTR
jgi:phage virion morphogenesis protein